MAIIRADLGDGARSNMSHASLGLGLGILPATALIDTIRELMIGYLIDLEANVVTSSVHGSDVKASADLLSS